MKTKPTLTLLSAVLFAAFFGSVEAAPTPTTGIISSVQPLWSGVKSDNKHASQLGAMGVDFSTPSSQTIPGFGKNSISVESMKKLKTHGLWKLSGQKPVKTGSPISSISAIVPHAATNNVPDGGTSYLLLGFSLLGFGLLLRKSVT